MEKEDAKQQKPDGREKVSVETEQRAFAHLEQHAEVAGADVGLEHGERWVGGGWEPILQLSISRETDGPHLGEVRFDVAFSETDAERLAIQILDEIGGGNHA